MHRLQLIIAQYIWFHWKIILDFDLDRKVIMQMRILNSHVIILGYWNGIRKLEKP